MISPQDAAAIILNLVQPFDSEQDGEILELLAATGRILAEPVTSHLDFPHWDNSAMDGYAVRYVDVQHCSLENPIALQIVEEIPAGHLPQQALQPGQAARIMTGSMMPVGADTVVMQEDTQRQENKVTILAAPKPQAFVRRQGTYYEAGNFLLGAGAKLQAAEIAVLAAAQCAQVKVYRRPHVAILSTGSELVSIDQPLQPGQIVDSNQYALAALVTQAGAEPVLMGIVPDEPEALQVAIAQAIATTDLVLSSGGVSVGDYDYVEKILADLEATIHIRSVAVRPGKPLTVATFGTTTGKGEKSILYFGLPGNPGSALVSFWRFVQPALSKLSGLPDWEPRFVMARSRQALKSDGKRESYLGGKLLLVAGQYEFELAAGAHSSGNLINLAGINGLAVMAQGETAIAFGQPVQVLQI